MLDRIDTIWPQRLLQRELDSMWW